ncbi:MAG: glycosyltransferase family 39 protein [Candidatus Eisenbacteria bacterium]
MTGAKHSSTQRVAAKGRTELWVLLALVLLGAALRIVYLTEAMRSPDFTKPHVDADLHNYWARGLAFGDWAPKDGNPDPEIRTTPYFRPPGYPYFLALLYKLGGKGYLWPKLAQMLLGLGSAVLAYRIARARLGSIAALVWAGLLATAWVFIYFEGEFQEPALFIALLLLLILALLRWGDAPSFPRAATAGLVVGVAGLVRPNALLLGAAALAWMFWIARRRSLRRTALHLAITAATAALGIAPATLRNLAAGGEFVPISTNGGINLFIGNNQNAEGLVVANTELGTLDTCYDWPEIVKNLSRKLGHPVSHAEASRWFEREAWSYIGSHPGRAIALLGQKALLFLGPLEPPDNKILEGERASAAVLRWNPWSFPLLFGLALTGAALFVARARAGVVREQELHFASLLGLLSAAWLLSFLPFAVTARYRAPFLPLVLPFAGYLAGELATMWRGGDASSRRGALTWSAVAAVLVAAAHLDLAGYKPSLARWHYQRGIAEKNLGQLTDAITEYRAALALNSDYLGPLRDLGAALASSGKIAESIPYFEQATKRDPSHAVTWMNLATAYEATGRDAEALASYRRVLALRNDAPRARQGAERLAARLAGASSGGAP